MIYVLVAIGLYFLFIFAGFVLQNNSTPLNNTQSQTSERLAFNPIEAQRIGQQIIFFISNDVLLFDENESPYW